MHPQRSLSCASVDASSLIRLSDDGWPLIVGAVDLDRRPIASRGWGVRAGADGTLRIALDAHDHTLLTAVDATRSLAVTAADVETLESVQFKGEAEVVGRAGPHDLASVERHVDRMQAAIEAIDHHPRGITNRFLPGDYVVVRFRPSATFVQTPGPGAGAAVQP